MDKVEAIRKGCVHFLNSPGLKKRPSPNHERAATARVRLSELFGTKSDLPADKLTVITESVSALNEIIPPAVEVVDAAPFEVVRVVCDNELLKNIVTKESPELVPYHRKGNIVYSDVPGSFKVKGFGKMIIAIPTEWRVEDGERKFFCFSLFNKDDGKPWEYRTVEGPIQSVKTIIEYALKGRELTLRNKEILEEVIASEKIVWELPKEK